MRNTAFELLFISVVAITCFVLGARCASPAYESHTEIHTVTDTTYVTHIDTVRVTVRDTVRVDVAVPVAAADPVDPEVNTYTQAITDSLITGTLHARVRGELLSWRLDYVPLFPMYITRTDTVFIDRQTTVTERLTPRERPVLTAGMWAGGTGAVFHYGPSVGWLDRSRRHWHYRYDLSTGAHLVGVSFPLFTL